MVYSKNKEAVMKKSIFKTMEETYTAAAFAEAGEHETAMHIAGIRSIAQTVTEKVMRVFDLHMSAASFAEAGCFETAKTIIEPQAGATAKRRPTLDEFLNDVGLSHARVRYGLATV